MGGAWVLFFWLNNYRIGRGIPMTISGNPPTLRPPTAPALTPNTAALKLTPKV
jgi:hypothetical protein